MNFLTQTYTCLAAHDAEEEGEMHPDSILNFTLVLDNS
jgi:hypothetical protein